MKTQNLILICLLFSAIGLAQPSPVCSGCDTWANDITNNEDGTFTAVSAAAYFWEICTGNAAIQGSNINQTVSITSNGAYTLKLVRFIGGDCFISCFDGEDNSLNCPTSTSSLNINEVDNCIDYQANVAVYNGDVDRVDFYFRICGVNNGNEVFAGSSDGNSWNMYTSPIYLPPGNNYNNCDLIVNAYPVLFDDTVCSKITNSITLSCSGNGTGLRKTTIYPNPTKASFNVVSNSEQEILNISVQNIFGKLIRSSSSETTIKLLGETKGVYFITVSFADGNTEVTKLVLE